MRTTIKKCSLVFYAVIFVAGASYADVITQEQVDFNNHFSQKPSVFDRTDNWCKDHKAGESCVIPGNAFEGGGPGFCERVKGYEVRNERGGPVIDLQCERTDPLVVERLFPIDKRNRDGLWMAAENACANGRFENSQEKELGWACTMPPVIADQFCTRLDVGQACVVTAVFGGNRETFQGVCKRHIEEKLVAFHPGDISKGIRPVITCEPREPTPASEFKRVSIWRKVVQ